MVKLLLLGTPGIVRDSWHQDIVDDARRIGWDVTVVRANGTPVNSVVEQARGADIFMWCYAHIYEPSGNALEMLKRIQDAGTVTVGVHLDLYWGLRQRERRIGNQAWWRCQYAYTSDGGQRDWASRGVNHRWLPPAVGRSKIGRVAPKGRHRYIFTGAYAHNVHGDHRMKMLSWARRKWGREFHWYGTSIHSRLLGQQLSAAVAHAHCVLGDAAPAPWYWSDRVPRILGRGAVLAHPRVEGLKEQGFDESNVVLFDRYDFDGLGRQIDELTEARREEMRESGLAVIRERHLWEHRLASIAEEVL